MSLVYTDAADKPLLVSRDSITGIYLASKKCSLPLYQCLINTLCTTDTSVFKEDAEEDSEMLKVGADISRLADMFNKLEISLMEHLEKQGTSLKEIRNLTDFLPFPLNDELHFPKMKAEDELEDAKTLRKFIKILTTRVWNFIDYHLLSHIISNFGSKKLKRRMDAYIAELEAFERETSVYNLMKSWPGRTMPPNFNELNIKIDRDPKDCTVKELNRYRKELCKEFWPPLSGFAMFVMYFKKIKEGCIQVTWIHPSYLTLKLHEFLKSPKVYTFFEKNRQILSVADQEITVLRSSKLI